MTKEEKSRISGKDATHLAMAEAKYPPVHISDSDRYAESSDNGGIMRLDDVDVVNPVPPQCCTGDHRLGALSVGIGSAPRRGNRRDRICGASLSAPKPEAHDRGLMRGNELVWQHIPPKNETRGAGARYIRGLRQTLVFVWPCLRGRFNERGAR